jgi:hypothetical protein
MTSGVTSVVPADAGSATFSPITCLPIRAHTTSVRLPEHPYYPSLDARLIAS